MKVFVEQQSVITGSPKRKLGPADDSKFPAKKRRTELDNNVKLENQPVPKKKATLKEVLKHGMQLRPRSRSVSPEVPKKKVTPRKKKPSPKKDSPPPTIKRPDYPEDAHSSERMVLRPKQKSPEQPLPHAAETREKSPSLVPAAAVAAPARPVDGKTEETARLPALYLGDDPKEATRNRRMRRDWFLARGSKKLKHVESKFDVTDRYIRPSGFTEREFDLCRPYMVKRDFEIEDPIPEEKKYYKAFLDQVRASPFGVTLSFSGGIIGKGFSPLMDELKNDDPRIKRYFEVLKRMAMGAIRRRRGQIYTATGVENLVRSFWFYLLSLRVQLGKDPSATPQIAELLFLKPPGTDKANFQLLEWKIKEGSKVVFSTAKIIE